MKQELPKTLRRLVGAIGSIGVLCALAACGGVNVAKGDRDYPTNNPMPSNLLTLHGTIDPSLDLHFRIAWVAKNSSCQYAVSRIEGAYAPYSAWSDLEVPRRSDDFSVSVPIDGVLPGRCQWRFAGVTYGGPSGFQSELIATNSYPLRAGQSPNGKTTLRCEWRTEAYNPDHHWALRCSWPKDEDPNAAVRGGILWWHPEATDFEVHFISK